MPEETNKGQAVLQLIEIVEELVSTYHHGNEGVAMFTDEQMNQASSIAQNLRQMVAA